MFRNQQVFTSCELFAVRIFEGKGRREWKNMNTGKLRWLPMVNEG